MSFAIYSSILVVVTVLIASSLALKCYHCGQYNDGVGSITPCINETYMSLKECSSKNHQFCIKYVSGGAYVKDCVAQCTEKEVWGTRTYCCNEDGCNSSNPLGTSISLVGLLAVVSFYYKRL